MTEPVKRRPYDSSRRQEQAQETRTRVLRAAHDLFVGQGYGRTTIADVARVAEVSPETIYSAFGNKVTLLHRVWDVTIGGDEQQTVFHERPEILALRAEPDLRVRFVLHARMATAVARRTAPFLRALQGAAGTDETAAEMLAEVDRQRLVGMGFMARDAAATGQLTVSEEECRDLIWATSDGALWHRLVVERGWTDEQYADHLGRMWVAAMVSRARSTP